MTAATVKSRKGRISASLSGGAAGKALQSAFIGTELPLELTRKRIEVVVITGTHLDWCVTSSPHCRSARCCIGSQPSIVPGH